MQAKAEVAACYIRDGSDFIELFRMGWNSERNNRSYRAKLCMNLRFAIECLLKGLVITHSDGVEQPEAAYGMARKAGHGLVTLQSLVQQRSKRTRPYFRASTRSIIVQLDTIKVDVRYEFDMAVEFADETFSDRMSESGLMSGTVGSDEWMLRICDHATYVET